jgi:putative transposase
MKKGKHTEEQIIGVLKQVEAGRTVKEVARELGVSEATIYTWKSKYGGMEVSEARRLKELEDENRRLKHMVKKVQRLGCLTPNTAKAIREQNANTSNIPWPSLPLLKVKANEVERTEGAMFTTQAEKATNFRSIRRYKRQEDIQQKSPNEYRA